MTGVSPVTVELQDKGLTFDRVVFGVRLRNGDAADDITDFLKSDAVTQEAVAFAQRLDALWSQPKPPARSAPVQFAIPNAKLGQPYAAAITAITVVSGSAGPLQFRNLMPQDLGVALDEATGQLHGTPLKDGQHTLHFQWTADGREWASGSCAWLVNPDPRDLWKVLEPAADAPYQKPHAAGQTVDCTAFKLAAGSRRGRSHEHGGSFRDDDFHIAHDAVSGWSVLVVADGAGSAKHSRWGSKIVCDSGGALLLEQLAGPAGARVSALLAQWDQEGAAQSVGVEFHHLFHDAAKACVLAIEAEAAQRQASPKDYATTMLAAAVQRVGADTFVATFWMGDGAIGVYGPRGRVRLMGAPDSGEFAGQTRFLDRAAITDNSFSKRLSVGRYADVTAVLLMTDGISDPRFETENALSDAGAWDALWDEIQPCLAAEQPHDKLVDWMGFFSPGHHDDRTLAVLW